MIAVLGAGSWGTTLANLLARKGETVRLWAYEAEVVEAINRRAREPAVPAGRAALRLAPRRSHDAREAVRGAAVIVSAPPSHAVRTVLTRLEGAVASGTLVVSATKGIETDTLALMSRGVRGVRCPARFAALSGPSFAQRGVRRASRPRSSRRQPIAEAARDAQRLFATPAFRVYSPTTSSASSSAGALKNVIAIAAGILEGLGLGHNPRAALDHARAGGDHAARRGAGRGPAARSPASPAWAIWCSRPPAA